MARSKSFPKFHGRSAGTPVLLLSVVILLLLPNAQAQSAESLFSGDLKFQDSTFPLYCRTNYTLCALVHFDKNYIDYERRGFFKIGTLPIMVVDGVSVEIQSTNSIAQGLGQLNEWMGGRRSSRLELRRVEFSAAFSQNRLEAGRARLANHGQLELLDGVRFVCGTNILRAPSAFLQITGTNAAQFVLATTPPSTNQFLAEASHGTSANLNLK